MTITHPTLTLPARNLDDPDQRVSKLLERTKAKLGFVPNMVETRGRPTSDDLERFTEAGFSETDVLQVLLAISVKTISDTEVDEAFAGRVWP